MNKLHLSNGLPKQEYLPIAIILAMFAIASFSWHSVPEKMPTHWNADGEADGYSGRFIGLFLLPMISLMMYLVLSFIPYIASYSQGIRSFHFLMLQVKLLLLVFMSGIYLASISQALGYAFNFNYVMVILFSVLMYFMGIILGKAKRNFFIGIRTPWTLQSDSVWDDTHKLGSIGFRVIAGLLLLNLLYIKYFILVLLVSLIGFSAYLVYYSYRQYMKAYKL
jgi:uncharacterized membrane protein